MGGCIIGRLSSRVGFLRDVRTVAVLLSSVVMSIVVGHAVVVDVLRSRPLIAVSAARASSIRGSLLLSARESRLSKWGIMT